MKKITVLGAGRVGSAIAIDLSYDFNVLLVDFSVGNLNKHKGYQNLTTKEFDLSVLENIDRAVRDADLVVSAVPGFMGFKTLKRIIENKKNVVDIAFFPEDPFLLDELAKQNDVVVVVDAGVAPGMGNIILGHHNSHMEVKSYECLVGGLPFVRQWPYEYKAVFSPIDVIEEYIRPARYVQNNQLVVREALSDTELVNFDGVGTLESWNSDGLRTLIYTMKNIPDMIEKTLRYPGSVEYLRVLRESGFFSYEEVEVNGMKIRPIDLTAKLLFPIWQLKPGEEDFTVMRIVIKGMEKGQNVEYSYHLFDKYNRDTNTISMARTTGYTCTAVANLIINNQFNRVGICPPEYVAVNNANLEKVLKYLKMRKVDYRIEKK
jgi:saccharopine dehydrogenase-like NADP-dependent oxidoreductase